MIIPFFKISLKETDKLHSMNASTFFVPSFLVFSFLAIDFFNRSSTYFSVEVKIFSWNRHIWVPWKYHIGLNQSCQVKIMSSFLLHKLWSYVCTPFKFIWGEALVNLIIPYTWLFKPYCALEVDIPYDLILLLHILEIGQLKLLQILHLKY